MEWKKIARIEYRIFHAIAYHALAITSSLQAMGQTFMGYFYR